MKNSLLGSPGVYTTVAVLAFAVFFGGLNDRPVPTIDGAVYASLARNIVTTGQWFPMMYLDRMFADHPPFFVWTIVASYKIFGVNDFAANFPMHLFSLLSVLVTAMIARRAQLNRGVTLAIALTLVGTRDFVLTSVRGYIEPLFILCTYTAFWCAMKQFERRGVFWAFACATCVALAWFAKGPPALWPTVFFVLLFLWKREPGMRRMPRILTYVVSLTIYGLIAAYLIKTFDQSGAFEHYFKKQILGSALEGRGGAQTFDPLYFVRILTKYYWPWLPLLFLAAYSALREIFLPQRKFEIPGLSIELPEDLFPNPMPTWIFLLFGLGFVGGFSIVKWKFWYYIAPAYPAFALAIGAGLYQKVAVVFEKPFFVRAVASGSLLWIAITSAFPVKTFRDRVPEVTAFRETIARSPVTGPVWFLHETRDHNLIATSGEWSFGREVKKVLSSEELSTQAQSPAWVITDENHWTDCRQSKLPKRWCENADLVQVTPQSLLILRR